ncbi:MAG: hypothetical protein IGR92_14115 [Leptolyngbyaceae cyanobacterium T60_A2020_046]|nr:hypothetical protein [Leptolyngbyaceae cyanobacterium T60_A2020_046]
MFSVEAREVKGDGDRAINHPFPDEHTRGRDRTTATSQHGPKSLTAGPCFGLELA